MGPSTEQDTPGRIFFFSHARTRSNLFMRILGNNPDISKIIYPFFSAYKYGPEPIFQRKAPIQSGVPDVDNSRHTYQYAFDTLMTKISSAEEERKTSFTMNHTYFIIDPDVIAMNLREMYGVKQPSKLQRPLIIERSNTTSSLDTDSIQETFTITAQNQTDRDVTGKVPPNPTLLPTSFLQSITTPIFVIRHPARFIPSFYRAARDAGYDVALDGPEFAISATLRWTRLVFDWFVAKNASDDPNQTRNDPARTSPDIPTTAARQFSPWNHYPILIDSEDLIQDRSFMPRLCTRLGLDPQYLQFTWDPTAPEARQANGSALAVFMHNLHESTGVDTAQIEREENIVIEEERKKLVEEFGEEIGLGLLRFVETAIPDWEYLRTWKF